MTRDEFILFQLKDQRSMWRVISLVCGGATIAALALGIFLIVSRGEVIGALTFAAMMLFFATQTLTARAQSQAYDAALEEVGDVPEGIYMNRNYSRQTASLIAHSWLSVKAYFGQIIAYGVCALMMYALSPLIFYCAAEEESSVFIGLGALLVAGGVWLTVLALQAYRNWKAIKLFEQEDLAEEAKQEGQAKPEEQEVPEELVNLKALVDSGILDNLDSPNNPDNPDNPSR